jgi:class 3 adenylate cyclase
VEEAINVQQRMGDQIMPFVPFDNFYNAVKHEKLFLVGRSGSGKSKTILQILRDSISTIENIYVINPRNPVGDESARINLEEFVNRLEKYDAVIWDNFPDDLIKRDRESARQVLEIISSKNVALLLVVLKPKYLEAFRDIANEMSELYSCEITYDANKIKKMMKLYGKLGQFRNLYEQYVEKNLGKISSILWQKDPIPLTILNYYRQLEYEDRNEQLFETIDKNKTQSLTATDIAERLINKNDFYEHQFRFMSGLQERCGDVDFLCTLRLFYELGLKRTKERVMNMQRSIFKSEPPLEPLQRLATWLYLSGLNYSIHDTPKTAINLVDATRLKIIEYIINNFDKMIQSDANQIYLLGLFLGKNIEYLSNPQFFLPEIIYKYMVSSRTFEKGLGHGIGEVFPYLEDDLKNLVLASIEFHVQIAQSMGDVLGSNFHQLLEYREQILDKLWKNTVFARYLGKSLGTIFHALPDEVQNEVLKIMQKNVQFSDGVGIGLQLDFLNEPTRKKILERASHDSQLSNGLGGANVRKIPYLHNEERSKVLGSKENDPNFSRGLGLELGHTFFKLPEQIRFQVLQKIEENIILAHGLGIGLGFNQDTYRELGKTIKRIRKNAGFASGFGMGAGVAWPYLPKNISDTLLAESEKNSALAEGLGYGYALRFPFLTREERKEILQKSEHDLDFATGLGQGLGYGWTFLDEEIHTSIFEMVQKRHVGLTKGIGWGFGYTINYLTQELREKVFDMLEKYADLAEGLGRGLGEVFCYLNEKFQQEMWLLAEKNSSFAKGLGTGIAYIFSYLIDQVQNTASQFSTREYILEQTSHNKHFANSLGFALSHYTSYMKTEVIDSVMGNLITKPYFAYAFAFGIGYQFQFITDVLQDRVFSSVRENPYFAHGLGTGIGYAWDSLDTITIEKLKDLVDENSGFQIGLGLSLGSRFPVLNENIQKSILETIERKPSLRDVFCSSFIEKGGSRYINEELKDRISRMANSSSMQTNNVELDYQMNEIRPDDYRLVCFRRSRINSMKETSDSAVVPDSMELSFSGKLQNYCLGFVDIVGSTNIVATLKEKEIASYYSIFINSMSTIIRKFGGKILKNIGDGLIFYFDINDSSNKYLFKNVLECLLAMVENHQNINAIHYQKHLPPLDYRISADYGMLETAKSRTSQADDLFGSMINLCVKINFKAKLDGLVIGDSLYSKIKDFAFKDYSYSEIGAYSVMSNQLYHVYSLERYEKIIS